MKLEFCRRHKLMFLTINRLYCITPASVNMKDVIINKYSFYFKKDVSK